jgi:hypothetical protein
MGEEARRRCALQVEEADRGEACCWGSEEVRGRRDLLGEEAGGGGSAEGHDTGTTTPVVTGASTGEVVAAAAGRGGFLGLGEAAAAAGRGGFRGGGSRGAQVAWWENGSQGTDGEAHGLRGKNEKQRRYAGEGAGSLGKPVRAVDARRTTRIDGRSVKNNFVLFRSRDENALQKITSHEHRVY